MFLKKSHQNLSNEGSNFIYAQTQPFFDKLPEITDFGLLQQFQNGERF